MNNLCRKIIKLSLFFIVNEKMLFLLWLILLMNNAIFSQQTNNYADYYKTCNVALEYKVKGDYLKAIQLYDSIFNRYYPFVDDVKRLAQCYYAINDTTNYHNTLRLLISCGYKIESNIPLIKEDGTLYRLRTEDDRLIFPEFFYNEYDLLRNEFLVRNDHDANLYMQAISTIDQFASNSRWFMAPSSKKIGIVEDATFNTKGFFLMSLLQSNVNLSRQYTDYWEDWYFVVAMLHGAQTLANKPNELKNYFSMLEHHVTIGNLYPEQYAAIVDNIYYRKNKTTMYGAHRPLFLNKNGIIELEKKNFILDISHVDERRTLLCLPPLWVSYKEKEYPIPDSYTFPDSLKK